jgi:hypothetical protein
MTRGSVAAGAAEPYARATPVGRQRPASQLHRWAAHRAHA